MFNVYQHERRSKSVNDFMKKEQREIRDKRFHEFKQSQLLEKYNDRVEHFLQNMVNNPIILEKHVEPLQIVPRVSNPTKFKGNANFISRGFRTEKERIQQSFENSTCFDSSPLNVTHQFRSRAKKKEINQRMYFKPRTSIERIQDVVKNNRYMSEDVDNYQSCDK